ncbi:undecaprenyl-diphosphate phosphatase [Ketobacter sp.]
MGILEAIIIGIVEGITEFLPVSSTAHIVMTMKYFGIEQNAFTIMFNIVVQAAPIIAVALIFVDRLCNGIDIWLKLAVAFLPTGFAGLLIYDYLLSIFTSNITVIAMVVTGLAFIISELWYRRKGGGTTVDLDDVSYGQAVFVGFSQVLSLIPGISRSGTTIIGGIMAGMDREVAIRFSFLLALPTMSAATGYSLLREASSLNTHEVILIGVAFVAAFLSSWVVVKLLLSFIAKVTYDVFGIYLLLTAAAFVYFS